MGAGPVKHEEHVALIRDGVAGAGSRWLELGAGTGEFTLALADVLGGAGDVVALDLDRWALGELVARVSDRYPDTTLEAVTGDLVEGIPAGPFDGVLAANSLHYVDDLVRVLGTIHGALARGGRLVIVEYDADRGNPWVPYPISFARFAAIAPEAGFDPPALIRRVPSRFLGAMYGAVTARS